MLKKKKIGVIICHYSLNKSYNICFKAVWRKMKKLGYLQLMKNNPWAVKILRMLMVIPLLPARRIEEGFDEVNRYAEAHNIDLHLLFNYYER